MTRRNAVLSCLLWALAPPLAGGEPGPTRQTAPDAVTKALPLIWITAYANDVMSYIPSLRVLREGGYGGSISMIYYGLPSAWGPRIEELIVAAVHDQVAKVRLGQRGPP